MPLVNTGIGVSQKDNLIEAAREAAQKAKEELGDKKPKLLMFFCTYTYPEEQYQKAQEAVYDVFEDKDVPLVGGSTLGFFAKDKYFFDPSLFGKTLGMVFKMMGKVFKPLKFIGAGVIALESDYLQIGTGLGTDAFKEPQLAGKTSIKMALDNLEYNPQVAYLAALKKGVGDITKIRPIDGFLITPGNDPRGRFRDSEIAEGITSVTKSSLRIQGGGVCGGVSETRTLTGYTFYNGKVYKGAVISVVLGSELVIGHGVGTGAKPIDNIGLVNKVRDKWTIEEINGKPAVEVVFETLKKYTKIEKEEFVKAPAVMGIRGYALVFPEARGDFYWPLFPVRVKEGKCVEMMMPIKEGMLLALGEVTKESAKKATIDAAKLMIEDVNSKDFNLVLFFSCAVRGVVLGKDYFYEIKKIKETVGDKDLPVFGICSTGETAFYKTGSSVGTGFTITMMGISNHLISEIRE